MIIVCCWFFKTFARDSVVEQKYPTCPSWESNPGRWTYRQTLYYIAVKAGLRSVFFFTLTLWHSHPPIWIWPWISWYRNHVKWDQGRYLCTERSYGVFFYGGRHCHWGKISNLPQLGIKPRSLDLQANTLPRPCKRRLLPQSSKSVFIYT